MAISLKTGVNRQWRIARWPKGLSTEADFRWTESPVPRPGPGEALVQNKLLSLDPTNRVWLWERDSYLPQQQVGDVMRSVGAGTVVESNNPALPVGTPVYGVFGWQDYAVVGQNDLVLPLPNDPNIPLT
ncbi:MAG: NADP-dependent oxidoreductase, partial [Acidobacteriia bacterium]|nr:NADP-dependent oxidoreductase [Terriglobia bacterium]